MHHPDQPNNDFTVCLDCIKDPICREALKSLAHCENECVVCNAHTAAVVASTLVPSVAGIVRKAYEEFDDTIYEYGRGMDLPGVIKRVLAISDDAICERIATLIFDNSEGQDRDFFAAGVRYKLQRRDFDDQESERVFAAQMWEKRANEFKHRRRYFNRDAKEFFARLFDVALQARNTGLFKTFDVARHMVPAGTPIYRARRVDSPSTRDALFKNPEAELGAPPKTIAGQNRMNASGVPLFYGAKDIATCVAEIRPSIGDEVATGVFVTTRELKFFDFTRFSMSGIKNELSVWNDDYVERRDTLILLKYIEQLIGQPVRKGDTDYIMTQAMAEYIRFDADGGFDGIIFRSVQTEKGFNYVIFSDKGNEAALEDTNWEPGFPVQLDTKTNKKSLRLHRIARISYEIES
ncbi:RES domain-containing protein [Paraburkholderia bannensis]|nr:RES family NAD+ phosphorylase [Paraburkholderia bannensis]RQM44437.1 RES domain-containing protein [Paraburkholderia bannensis]